MKVNLEGGGRFCYFFRMASVSVVPASGNTVGVDRLPEEMNDMKIRDDKVYDFFLLLVDIFAAS